MGFDNGVRDFAARLANIPKAIRQTDSKAILTNAEEWVRVSKATAPKDPPDGTPLADSIRNYATDTGGQVVRAGGPTTTKDSLAGPSDYAIHQEFGTAEMPASPFFWPVYRSFKKRWASRRSRAMSKALKEFNNGK
jgi:HK97 gp10 family phage protein